MPILFVEQKWSHTVFAKLKNFLYNEVYINIVQGSDETVIYVEELDSKGQSNSFEDRFNSSGKSDIYEYINKYITKSPIHYISILDPSLSQGVAPTCSSQEMKKFCDLGQVEHVCVDDSWVLYTSKLDLLELQGRYKKTGIDFVFSPFIILNKFFSDKIKGDLTLYILVSEDYMALSIFENAQLKFGVLLDMQRDEDSSDELMMDVDDVDDEEELILDDIDSGSVDLDDIDVDDDDIGGFDELDDLDDMDGFDDMDDFDSDELDEDTFSSTEKQLDDIVEQSSFGEDYHRFSLIQGAVNSFYKDSKYDSDFVQSVYVADGIGLSGEFKKFLEEEMFLSVFIRKVDIAQEMSELAKEEKK